MEAIQISSLSFDGSHVAKQALYPLLGAIRHSSEHRCRGHGCQEIPSHVAKIDLVVSSHVCGDRCWSESHSTMFPVKQISVVSGDVDSTATINRKLESHVGCGKINVVGLC
ncbi:hypothetical protein SLA2020_026790 [Shorea laevis]